MARRLALALVAVLVVSAGAVSPAAAAVSVGVTSSEGLRIAVIGSITTELSVRPTSDGTKLDVTEQSAQMVPGSGCVQVDSANPQRLRCNRPSLNFVTFVGGALRDRLFVLPGSGDCQCFGNGGNDELNIGDGADLLDGGAGNDAISAGAGGDVVRGGDGNDSIAGGLGSDDEFGGAGDDSFAQGGVTQGADDIRGEGGENDSVSYGLRRTKIVVTSDDNANDGAPADGHSALFGEGDNVRRDIEVVRGGSGPDDLHGRKVFGGSGNDTVRGTFLVGDLGVDNFIAFGGDDTLMARDAVDDQVNQPFLCSSGFDVLDVDVRDDDTRPLPEGSCEQIVQGMVGETPNVVVRSARRGRRGRLRIRLRCPRRTRNGCRGRLRVGVVRGKGRGARARYGKRVRYRIRRGRSKTVIARVRGRRTPRRRARVRVKSRERGTLGPRTTIRTLRVKR